MKTVYVAMSGGVDSSVAAYLLKQQGYRVVGVFMKPWSPFGRSPEGRQQCMWQKERADALLIASQLDIRLFTWDISRDYRVHVADPMIRGYREGTTPNPDVECNRNIKFGLFYERALREGADVIATGHYARISRVDGMAYLMKAKDQNKDQTYFLWAIPRRVLSRTLFPIGNLTKPQVRAIARKAGLVTSDKKDSQGICFIGELNVKDFLQSRIPAKSGTIFHRDGRVLGTHDGAAYYTIGQRHGLDIKDGKGPYVVIAKDIKRNTVTVGDERDLLCSEVRITGTNWLAPRPAVSDHVRIKIRYRTEAVPAVIGRAGKITCSHPVRAVTPGQSVVIYRGNRVLGGGIIVD